MSFNVVLDNVLTFAFDEALTEEQQQAFRDINDNNAFDNIFVTKFGCIVQKVEDSTEQDFEELCEYFQSVYEEVKNS